ncbi:SctD/MshK family protein [Paracoccus sediminicola]|uniref:SctD/MshK family protein n=1 Tax=Paracoccus sediminicola TaxID=3017783 RepID=UPI0022EFF232|nr:hypothetical protein [Paracoccus sediminicola]WBU57193.1 hypothetical protein PAF18_01730 [Paracoccus sediminicola]
MTSQAKPFLLTVLSGPNAGATARIASGRFSIGGGESDRIVLSGLPADRLALRLTDDRVRLRPAGAEIRYEDHHSGELRILRADKTHEAELPATLRLDAETSILLSRTGAHGPAKRGLRAGAGAAGLALAAGLWIGAQFGGPATPANAAFSAVESADTAIAAAGTPGVADATAEDFETTTTGAARLVATSPRLSCDAECVEGISTEFRARMRDAGLTGLTLRAEDGVLRVDGTMSAEQAGVWRELRAKFEAENGQSLPLVAQISEGQPKPVLAIASVWLGQDPEIRTRSGDVLRVGDQTGDGWTVEAISRGEVGLERDGEQISVRF